MSKVLAILFLAMVASAAATYKHDPVEECIHSHRCWTKGTRAVCGISPHGKYVSFPNRCYFACTNLESGDNWEIAFWYTPHRSCKCEKWGKRCTSPCRKPRHPEPKPCRHGLYC